MLGLGTTMPLDRPRFFCLLLPLLLAGPPGGCKTVPRVRPSLPVVRFGGCRVCESIVPGRSFARYFGARPVCGGACVSFPHDASWANASEKNGPHPAVIFRLQKPRPSLAKKERKKTLPIDRSSARESCTHGAGRTRRAAIGHGRGGGRGPRGLVDPPGGESEHLLRLAAWELNNNNPKGRMA